MKVFDLRIPLGYLFATLGTLLIIAGLIGSPDANARSLGININVRLTVYFTNPNSWLTRAVSNFRTLRRRSQ